MLRRSRNPDLSGRKLLFIFFTFYVSLFTFDVFSQWITWQKTYGVNGSIEYGYSIVQTPDGGYIAAGRKNGMYIMRLNPFGDTIWTKSPPLSEAHAIIKTNDNNYAVMGILGDVIKININGDSIWHKAYDPTVRTRNIIQTSDNNFILCGNTTSINPYLLKLNSSGNIIYEKIFLGFWQSGFSDLTISIEGNYVLGGNYSDSNILSGKLFVMKTDTAGTQIWFRGYDSLKIPTQSITLSNDGGYAICGYKGGPTTTFITKFDFQGIIQWIKYYFSGYNQPYSLISSQDGGYALSGTWDSLGNSNYFVYLLKTDSLGNEQWHNTYGFNNNDAGRCVRQTLDSGYIINGIRDNFQWGDIYIIKTDKNGYANPPIGIYPISSEIPKNFRLFPNYPNPFNPTTKITFQLPKAGFVKIVVYDILGREVSIPVHQTVMPGEYEVMFDAHNLASGIYFYQLIIDGNIIDTKKMILMK